MIKSQMLCTQHVRIVPRRQFRAKTSGGARNARGNLRNRNTSETLLLFRCPLSYPLIIGTRYKINMVAKDSSGDMRLEGFNDLGLSLFGGMTAGELVEIQVSLARTTVMCIQPESYHLF